MFWIRIDLPVPAAAEAAVFNVCFFLDEFMQVMQMLTPITEKVPPFLGCSLNKKFK